MHLSSLYLSISWYIVVVPSIGNELISLQGFVPPRAEESPLGVDAFAEVTSQYLERSSDSRGVLRHGHREMPAFKNNLFKKNSFPKAETDKKMTDRVLEVRIWGTV